MKKLLLTTILGAAATITFAQSVNFGVKGGLNISDQTGGMTDKFNLKHQSTPGFNAGIIMDVNFHNFTLQPGISYTTKGEKVPAQPNTNPLYGPTTYIFPESIYRLNYIEASVNALYNIRILQVAAIQLGGGPFLGQGISASRSTGGSKQAASFSNDPNVFIHYKNPDYGVNFIAGIEVNKKILVDFGHSLGTADVAYYSTKTQNRVMSISVGYLFR
jgi:hypothetical protein